jgi:hypothetical protein
VGLLHPLHLHSDIVYLLYLATTQGNWSKNLAAEQYYDGQSSR